MVRSRWACNLGSARGIGLLCVCHHAAPIDDIRAGPAVPQPLARGQGIATVDALSGGWLIVGAAGGYLRSEFAALGAPFEDKGAALRRGARGDHRVVDWAVLHRSRTSLRRQGAGERAHPGAASAPADLACRQRPYRAASGARMAQGWSPLVIDGAAARTTRTPALPDARALAGAIRELRELLAEAGRTSDSVEVQAQSVQSAFPVNGGSVEQLPTSHQ